MMSLREAMNRLFDQEVGRYNRGTFGEETDGMSIAMDMYETGDSVVLEAVLPGVKPEEVQITVTGNTLTIKGEVQQDEEEQKGNIYFRERRFGSFRRTVTLPPNVDPDAIDASFESGMLKLRIPKTEEAKPKQIPIKSQEQN
jgi:HSP20 family protein